MLDLRRVNLGYVASKHRLKEQVRKEQKRLDCFCYGSSNLQRFGPQLLSGRLAREGSDLALQATRLPRKRWESDNCFPQLWLHPEKL